MARVVLCAMPSALGLCLHASVLLKCSLLFVEPTRKKRDLSIKVIENRYDFP